MTDYLTDFVQESEERITELNNALLTLERDPTDDDAMENIFRVAHTLKGNCGAMGLESASDLAHAIEDLLDAVRRGELAVTPELMDVVFDAVDELETMIDEVAADGEIETDPSETIAALRDQLDDGDGPPSITTPSTDEIDAVIERFEPPADDEHQAYLARLAIADGEGVNNGKLVVDALIDAFDLIGTEPPQEAVEAGNYGGQFDAVFGTAVGKAAIASGLEPVEEVADFELVDVSDRFAAREDAEPSETDAAAEPADDISVDDAADLEVDELLDEFDEFDNLDEMVEDVDDDELEAFEDMGEAGSFDDLLDDDDLDLEDDLGDPAADSADPADDGATAEAAESAADESTAADEDDDVEDANAVFNELKDEVEMVGFDELQDELDELEFDEFDNDDEVDMDELIGDDVDVDDDSFLQDSEPTEAAVDDILVDASDDADEAVDSAGDDLLGDDEIGDELMVDDETDDILPDNDEAGDELVADDETDDEDAAVDPAPDAAEQSATATESDVESSPAASDSEPAAETETSADETDDDLEQPPVADDGEPDGLEDDATVTAASSADDPSTAVDSADEDATEPESASDEFETEVAAEPETEADADADADTVEADEMDDDSEEPAVSAESDALESDDGDDAATDPDETSGDAVVSEAESDDSSTDDPGIEADDGLETSSEDEFDSVVSFDDESDDTVDADAESVDADDAVAADDESVDAESADDDPFAADAADDPFAADSDADPFGTDDDPFGTGDDDPFAAETADDPFADDSFETEFGAADNDFDDVATADASTDDTVAADEGTVDDVLEGDFDDDFGTESTTDSSADDPSFDDESAETDADTGDDDTVVRRIDEPTLESPELTLPDDSDRPDADQQTDEIQSVRVDVEQIDSLLTLVEGLVTSRVRLRHAATEGDESDALEAELDDLEDLTTELQETVMDIRLVPLQTVANRLPRVVRDIARDQDKEVALEMTGEDVELDRSILDRIGDPLIHLVRNAVDHGIEPPEEREAADKPPEGSVEVHADRSRDRVTITVEDDGVGLDPDRLRSEAVDADILSEAEAADLSDDDVYELIFHPGLSTADEVTDVSGRGVGMDVVKRTIEDLEGTVSIDSEVGAGTTITMTLPVSVAIDDILFVESGGEEFGLPTKAVQDIEPATNVETVDGQPVLTDGDDAYSVIQLDEVLETPRAGANGDGMVVRIRDDVRSVALHCDHVHGQQEVVVKPFEGFMGDIPGLSGATVRGRGEVVNILDVSTL